MTKEIAKKLEYESIPADKLLDKLSKQMKGKK